LDRKIFLDLSKHTNARVGRKNPEDPDNMPEICLGGVGIQLQHCKFETSSDGTFITPLSEAAMGAITINGTKLTSMKKTKLKANDRIIFGNASAFLFRNQDKASEATVQDSKEHPITYEYAMNEKTAKENEQDLKKKEEERKALEEETSKKLAELKAQQDQEKAEQEKMRQKMQKEYEDMLAKMKAEIDAKHDDEKAKQDALDREAKMRIEMELKLE
jgi:hypothetical protein